MYGSSPSTHSAVVAIRIFFVSGLEKGLLFREEGPWLSYGCDE